MKTISFIVSRPGSWVGLKKRGVFRFRFFFPLVGGGPFVVAELRRVFGDCRKVFFKTFLVMLRLFDDLNLPIAMEAKVEAEITVYQRSL